MKAEIHIECGDSRRMLKVLPDSSVHLVVTDPPYFIDSMENKWDVARLNEKKKAAKVIGGLPVGMKFDPAAGRRFEAFMKEISDEVIRVLKPGGFYIAFSQARLYHRLGIAVEDAGFEVRDMMGWTYEGQAKAFSQDHFVNRMKITDVEKARMITELGGRKTPQLKPMIEPMVLGQKPKDGTFVGNWMRHHTGLMDVGVSLDGRFPGNLMSVPKPDSVERGDGAHLTPKPVRLIEHLIRLFSEEGQVVLDPFMGSGTHGVAAVRTGRSFIGMELDAEYCKLAKKRIEGLV